MTKTNSYKKLVKGFGKMFKRIDNPEELGNLIMEKNMLKDEKDRITEMKIEPKDYVGYLDEASVRMVIPKNLFIKGIIENNFSPRREDSVKFFLNPKQKVYEKGVVENGKGTLSPELLKEILDIFRGFSGDDDIEITIKDSSPIRIENEYFIFFLAPRDKNDKGGER